MTELLEYLLEMDTELFLWLNNFGSEKWDGFWLWMTDKETWYPLYLILLVLAGFYLKKWKKFSVFVLITVLLVTIVDQSTSSFFKPLFGRLRPCHYEELDGLFRLVKSYCGGQYSFFSGHSSNSFAVAFFMGLFIREKHKWLFPVLFIWATSVAYSRVYIGVHYPLDIFVGALWGACFGYLFYRIYLYIEEKYLN